MMGKLIGVSLVALTQLAVWAIAFGLFALYGVAMLVASGWPVNLPQIPPTLVVYLFLFFYSAIFFTQQFTRSSARWSRRRRRAATRAARHLLVDDGILHGLSRDSRAGFELRFLALDDPVFSPIIMLVRIITQQPPLWQIALSLFIGLLTIVGLVWLAARIYRTGMLMYGKRATIPEVIRWIRQT
jgi:ABC-2 type transport system permease protein